MYLPLQTLFPSHALESQRHFYLQVSSAFRGLHVSIFVQHFRAYARPISSGTFNILTLKQVSSYCEAQALTTFKQIERSTQKRIPLSRERASADQLDQQLRNYRTFLFLIPKLSSEASNERYLLTLPQEESLPQYCVKAKCSTQQKQSKIKKNLFLYCEFSQKATCILCTLLSYVMRRENAIAKLSSTTV